jgi:hypothetical protein
VLSPAPYLVTMILAALPATTPDRAARAEPPPYEPWRGEALRLPLAPRENALPTPTVGRAERPRHPVELMAQTGALVPVGGAGRLGSGRRGGLFPFGQGGLSALWRVHPYFSWGGFVEFGALRYDPAKRPAPNNPRPQFAMAGALMRVYALDSGSFDPYLELGLGYGQIERMSLAPNREHVEEVRGGPALQVGGGGDFFLAARLRAGAALDWANVYLDQNVAPRVHVSATVSVRLTIMVGSPL